MKKFLTEMFSGSEGVSHKRVLGTIGFLSLIVFMFTSEKNEVVEAVEFVTITMVAGSVAEKFVKRYEKGSEIS
jgi:hypothetical protein